jgi:regulator of cell morphogenesis and NO signaling
VGSRLESVDDRDTRLAAVTTTNEQETLMLDSTLTIHEILAQYPRTAGIFERFGIHSCCGGNASLVEAAHRDGADVDALVAAVRALVEDDHSHAPEIRDIAMG